MLHHIVAKRRPEYFPGTAQQGGYRRGGRSSLARGLNSSRAEQQHRSVDALELLDCVLLALRLLPRDPGSQPQQRFIRYNPIQSGKEKNTMTNAIQTTLDPVGFAPPVPAIDPGLLKLDGRTYRDLSRPAAAQRAAYHLAKAAQFLASPSSAPSAIGNHFANFTNRQTSADWIPQDSNQGAGAEGWMLHSHGNTSSRMVFKYPINDGSSPHTVVRAWVRGAPNNGKNSYVTLIEQLCADNPNHNPPYFCDGPTSSSTTVRHPTSAVNSPSIRADSSTLPALSYGRPHSPRPLPKRRDTPRPPTVSIWSPATIWTPNCMLPTA